MYEKDYHVKRRAFNIKSVNTYKHNILENHTLYVKISIFHFGVGLTETTGNPTCIKISSRFLFVSIHIHLDYISYEFQVSIPWNNGFTRIEV